MYGITKIKQVCPSRTREKINYRGETSASKYATRVEKYKTKHTDGSKRSVRI